MSSLKVEQKNIIIPQVLPSSSAVVKNAGTIFLKAAEWNLVGGSILGKVLKDELGGRFKVNFDQVADLLLWSDILKNKDIDNFDFPSLEWLLESFDLSDDTRKINEAVLKAAENISDCGMKLAIEFELFLQGVAHIKLVDQKGTSIFVEAKSKNVGFDNVQSDEAISFAEAMRMVGTEIIKNVHSAVFHCPADISSIAQTKKFLLSAFGNDPAEAVKEISLYNSQNVELVKYNYCPVKPRIFVLVLRSWEKSFPLILNSFKTGESAASLKILDITFFYKKLLNGDVLKDQDKETQKRVQTIAVSHSPTEKPFAVFLTNAADPAAIKKAVLDFLLSWAGLGGNDDLPSLNVSYQCGASPSLVLLDQAASFFESVTALRQVVNTLCQQYFFEQREPSIDEDKLIGQICSLPALLLDEEGVRGLFFTLAANDPVFPELKNAINRFNARVLSDPKGRRIILRIRSSAIS